MENLYKEKGGHEAYRFPIYGPSRSGKTYLGVNLVHLAKNKIPNLKVIVLSTTADNDPVWKQGIKESNKKLVDFYFKEPNTDAFSFIDRQIRNKRRKFPLLVYIDDQGDNTAIKLRRVFNPIRDIANLAFHYNTYLIVCHQSVTQTLPILAVNGDVICSKKLRDLNERELFRKKFLGEYTKEEAERIYAAAWDKDFDTLVVDRTKPNKTLIFRNFTEPIDVRGENMTKL